MQQNRFLAYLFPVCLLSTHTNVSVAMGSSLTDFTEDNCTLSTSSGIDETFSKIFEKQFSLGEGGKVDIENIHGAVDVDTWDKAEVQIVVTVEVDASSESKANHTFERIDIDFSHGDHFVKAKTEIDAKKSFWWFMQDWWGDDDIRINYHVMMPKTAHLEISNKYGDIELEDIDGDVQIDQKYGDLQIAHTSGSLDLSLGYGNGVISQANRTRAEISYYKLRIEDANELDIDSKYSRLAVESINIVRAYSAYDKYHLDEVGTLVNEGKYDEIHVEKIEELKIKTKYTRIDLDELTIGLDAQLSYGGLQIDQIHPGFTGMNVESRYTKVSINTDALQDFILAVSGRYVNVSLPAGLTLTRERRENSEIDLSGYRGDVGAEASLNFGAHYGHLKLR
ncbi:MAG: hypothetical protein HKN87_11210 [Saprospiraceae bacterium]|nr:hypothetical protein [Saprospiraceae bacterium]